MTAPTPVPHSHADTVLRMVLYYDIFKHPLTRAELARLCGADVTDAIKELEGRGVVASSGSHVHRAGAAEHVDTRRERTREAERMWSHAYQSAAILARFPWVRGVLITGGLSKLSAPRGGDVDFLLLIEPGWVWTTKTTLQVLRRALPEQVRELFCTNYLLDTNHLLVDDRNAYTAMELATAVPLHGAEACVALLEANRWAEAFVPGYAWNIDRARNARPLGGAAWIERTAAPFQGTVEGPALRLWSEFWDRKYSWLPESARSQRFKRRPEIATNHLHDFQDFVLGEFAARCRALGID